MWLHTDARFRIKSSCLHEREWRKPSPSLFATEIAIPIGSNLSPRLQSVEGPNRMRTIRQLIPVPAGRRPPQSHVPSRSDESTRGGVQRFAP